MKNKFNLNNYFLISYNLDINNFKNNNKEIQYEYGQKTYVNIYKEKNKKTFFIGDPFINNKNYKNIFNFWKNNSENIETFKQIDSEFVIIEVYNDKKIRIINSRFSSPQIYYYKDRNCFLVSTNYFVLAFVLKKINKFELNENSIYEFLHFRRLFGNSTLDKRSKILEPAVYLQYHNGQIINTPYWKPKFNKKNKGLNYFSSKLKKAIYNSEKIKIPKDTHGNYIMLSGGLDTRFISSIIKKFNGSFTLSYSDNREKRTAKKIAQIVNMKHESIKINKDHYKNNFYHNVRAIGGSYMGDSLLMGHTKIINDAKILYSGYGLDYFFQGMYIPVNFIKIFGKKTYFKINKNIKEPVANFFYDNISYKNNCSYLENLYDDQSKSSYKKKLLDKFNLIIANSDKFDKLNNFEKYEKLNFHNISRHITYGGQLALSEMSRHKVISYTNEIYDLYLEIPNKYRFDGKILKKTLKKINVKLANLISANTNSRVIDSHIQLSIKHIFRHIFSKIFLYKNNIKNERTWNEIKDITNKDLREIIDNFDISIFKEIQSLNYQKIEKLFKDFKLKKVEGNKTILLLITIGVFLEQLK